ncbi:MAG: ParB/RepB/Spo0J family partition protein, partial [Actinomycetota bacterium]
MSDELDALLGLGPGAGGPVPRYPAPGGGPSGVDDGDGERGTELLWIHPAAVRPNHRQPREYFDEDELGALAASIEEVGILQPLLVRRIDENQYELIAGERRWRAAQRAGVEEIPVLVRRTDDQGSLEEAVVENLHRQDLTGVEEAAAYRQLMDDFGLTQEAVAQRVGKSRSAVANTLRLLLLAPEVQRLIATRQLSSGHARALLGLSERSAQAELAARIVADELSVRQTEEIVRRG